MSNANARPGPQVAKGCLWLTMGCVLFLIPLALILGFAVYAVVVTVVDGGHSKPCGTASCANSNNGDGGGSSGGDGGDDGGDGGGDGGD
jgi:hypothetical protein